MSINSNLQLRVCNNYEGGYFNAFAKLAEEKGLSAVIHLGDYIYEYGPGKYGDKSLDRKHIPPHEIVTLQDYRQRYAQYRRDPESTSSTCSTFHLSPFGMTTKSLTIHTKTVRKITRQMKVIIFDAKPLHVQAYYEWLPIRGKYRPLPYFFFWRALPTLLCSMSVSPAAPATPTALLIRKIQAPEHTMLGDVQYDWFARNLKSSNAHWKLIGNQVIYSYLNWGWPKFTINLDSWDGYPAEQQKVADLIRKNKIKNVIFLTGDTHSSWAI